MNTRDKAFNQVKAILGKLDRSIEEARAKRLGRGEVRPADQPKAEGRPMRARPLRRGEGGHGSAWGAA